ncbi:MAG TPA: carboxypeptidase regulatory-like domain-containing protein [Gemmatimonadaceae bacterium]|jgi:hypothetical protein
MQTTSNMPAVRRTRVAGWHVASIVAAVMLWSVPVAAQKGRVTGLVRDSAGAPLPEADVSITSAHILTRTDNSGAFVLSRVDPGQAEVSVRRLGYVPRSVQVDVKPNTNDTLVVVMMAQALELPGVDINDHTRRHMLWIEDFYRRRATGIGGTFFTRDDIEARHASRLSDVLRDAPGVRFVRSRGGSGIRFDSPANFRRDCLPQYFVDGQRVPNLEVDDFSARDIEGVELYAGPSSTPTQFQQGAVSSCGTVVIWSRVPGT